MSENGESQPEAGPSNAADDDSDEEYLPSEEDDGDEIVLPNLQYSKSKKKSLDDGKISRFRERIDAWKTAKKASHSYLEKKSQNATSLQELEPLRNVGNGLKIPESLWKRLYKYQKTGIKWLWELNCIESGGLLGDEMGLGKTIQIIGFLAGVSCSGGGKWNGLGPSIIVAPATVLHQWVAHFHEWWPPFRVAVLHASGSFDGCSDRLIKEMHTDQGIIITTYAGVIKNSVALGLRKWHYIILDEGHKIRNSDTQISKVVKKFNTRHRIVVTGSPMQNNLQELWSLFDFMSPGLLGTLSTFMEHFAFPITQGGYSNATAIQEATAYSLATTLKELITPYMLRRTKNEVKDHLNLPDKNEQVLFCSLTDEQKDLYKSYLLSTTVRSILDKESRFGDPLRAKILVAISTLKKICNHPDLFLYEVDDEEEPSISSQFGYWRRAGKMIVLNSLLKMWKKQGHRTLIFTQSRAMICILELFLQEHHYKYLRMDGSTSISSRQPMIKTFNSDDSYLVFLATTRVGGLGVNLTGADRVIIYDPDWNPATDGQAKERAWRIGQTRDVVIYRLLSAGSIEEKIYQRQVFKQLLSNKVLLDPNQKNYLKTSTLQGLFSLEEPDKAGSTETTTIFKHTQVSLDTKKSDKPKHDIVIANGNVSFSRKKMKAMKLLAQQISKNVFKDNENLNSSNKSKEKIIPDESEHLIDDQETEIDFSTAMSETEAVTMFAKRIMESQENKNEEKSQEVSENQENDIKKLDTNNKLEIESEGTKSNLKKPSKRVRNFMCDNKIEENIEHLENVKKYRPSKTEKDDISKTSDSDQYILEKLFSKSNLRSALEHDKVVGLAEREERIRIRAEAEQRSSHALRMLRKSRLKKWNW